ncbi:hypothetical protein OIV83_000148 [Microbotryomycetes sp. JL201]|nr:hypothetical protein OIV83_000148 [Microbotryomycetes sp. JL201]
MAARSFSSSYAASTSKPSRLHKTTLARQQRQARSGDHSAAASGSGRQGKAANAMPLAEAAKTLQALHLHTPNAAYEINILAKPAQTVQLNALRGRVFLPHSCANATKSSTLVVMATGAAAQQARQAGADIVGGEELVEQILNGQVSPDKLITTPDMLPLLQRNANVARLLGPKGLMPSAKRGTVSTDLAQAVKEARGGLDWKGDQQGAVRAAIGRLHFDEDKLLDNVHTLLASVSDTALGGTGAVNGTPSRVRRPGISRVMLSSTQGPGISLTDV